MWEPTPKAASVRAVHRALELGVNGFDVAPRYGDGKAEDVLGRALQDRPDPVIVATKVRLSADDLFDVAGAVRRSMDASLRRLRRDAVDSLHFHNRLTPQRGERPDSFSAEDVLGAVLEAYQHVQQAGTTRFIGISGMGPDVPVLKYPLNFLYFLHTYTRRCNRPREF